MARAGLTRAAITAAALGLLDEGGLAAITARALAARLGVQAGALYHHLPDMRALLDEVATALLREAAAEPVPGGPWPDVVRGVAARLRRVLLRHRDGGRVLAGSRTTDPALLTAMEAPLAALTDAGLSLESAVWTLQAVLAFTLGSVIEEQHRRDDEPAAYDPAARAAAIDASTAPLSAAASQPLFGDPDAPFDWGLDLLVSGIAARLPSGDAAPAGVTG